MRFGKSAEEAEKEAPRNAGGSWMKYPREGDNEIHILDEPDKWVYYWEHYNPGGFAFPCTNDRDTCPGCTSDVEKMRKASRKIAFNAHDGEYTNVWKVPKTVADKLKNRYERIGSITDRPYRITQIKGSNNRVDYDVEGLDKTSMPDVEDFKQDPEDLLAEAYEEAWGDDSKVRATQAKAKENDAETKVRAKITRSKPEEVKREEPEEVKREEPEDRVYSEDELRKMDVWDLVAIANREGLGNPPQNVDSPDQIVDWMLEKVG